MKSQNTNQTMIPFTMKHHSHLTMLALLLTAVQLPAAFETWTNKSGRDAQLELISVSGEDGAKAGLFRMKDGRTVTITAADLAEADAKRLAAFKPADAPAAGTTPAAPADGGGASVFEPFLNGGLSKLDGKKIVRCKEWVHPAKFYVFYYSASWCGPCHQFTPSLVEFYNGKKGSSFEIFLISRDESDSDLEKYVKELNQPWPFLKVSKTPKFDKEFKFGISSIPSMVICDPQGKVLNKGNAGLMLGELQNLLRE